MQQEFAGLNIDIEGASQSQILEGASQSQIHNEQNNKPISPKTAYQILHPTIFNKNNIQEIQQISWEEVADAEAEVIQLKDNFLPTGLTPLEDIFDSNDVPRKPKM